MDKGVAVGEQEKFSCSGKSRHLSYTSRARSRDDKRSPCSMGGYLLGDEDVVNVDKNDGIRSEVVLECQKYA